MHTVSILKCSSYDYDKVKKIIQKSIDNLGGIAQFINKEETVLIKVNMLSSKSPDEAVTTHPSFVRALSEILIEYGARVIIGDSPGGIFNKEILKTAYKRCGFMEAAMLSGASLNYNTDAVTVANPSGYILKSINVLAVLNEVDKVISVSKLKTHQMMTLTGAVKNLFGVIPGTNKAEYHVNMPNVNTFADCLVDICAYAAPVLSLMDGVVAMEGAGPSAGEPITVKAVLASASPYHLDVCAAYIMGIKSKSIPTIASCIKRGIVAGDFSDIRVKGRNIEEFAKRFKIPEQRYITMSKDNLPKPIIRIVNKYVKPRPVFSYDKCVSCRICEKNCPSKAIKISNFRPSVDLDGCIRCYCCQELCPKKAVEVYSPRINKMIFRH